MLTGHEEISWPMHEMGLELGLLVFLAFFVAGCVKGVVGLGLPTVAVGLLGLVIAPSQAAALLVVPSLVTNVWQLVAGPSYLHLVRRLWPMLVPICIATWAAAGQITHGSGTYADRALGGALILYSVPGLAKVQIYVSRRRETWLSPITGMATGIVTGATGVMVIPVVPYLQALGLEKNDLIQALGLSFTTSTIALAVGLASREIFMSPRLSSPLSAYFLHSRVCFWVTGFDRRSIRILFAWCSSLVCYLSAWP